MSKVTDFADKWERENGSASERPYTFAEAYAGNLCLELSERVERFEGATKELLLTFRERSGECFTCDLVVKRDGHSGDCPIPALEKLLADPERKDA